MHNVFRCGAGSSWPSLLINIRRSRWKATDRRTNNTRRERGKKRGGVRYVTRNHLRRTAVGCQGPCDWLSPVLKRSCCPWLTGNNRWCPPTGFRQKPSGVFCGLLLSWRKTNDEEGENARARARERDRDPEKLLRGGAGLGGGEVEEFSAIPLCEQKISLYSVFFFFSYQPFSSQSRYLPTWVALLHFFLFAASVCMCVIYGRSVFVVVFPSIVNSWYESLSCASTRSLSSGRKREVDSFLLNSREFVNSILGCDFLPWGKEHRRRSSSHVSQMCVCVCVCVRERERERERVCVCVCVWAWACFVFFFSFGENWIKWIWITENWTRFNMVWIFSFFLMRWGWFSNDGLVDWLITENFHQQQNSWALNLYPDFATRFP
jgi:hypothetical protein